MASGDCKSACPSSLLALKRPAMYTLLCAASMFLLMKLYPGLSSDHKTGPYSTGYDPCAGKPQCGISLTEHIHRSPGGNVSMDHEDPLEDTILKLEAILREYALQIEHLRGGMLNSSPQWQQLQTTSPRVIGYNKGYFEKLSQNPNVKTAFLRHDFEDMKRVLIKTYYEFSSNDCELVEGHSVYGDHLGKSMYNIECHSDMKVLLEGHPLPENHLTLGLPKDYDQGSDTEKVWTHVNLVRDAVVSNNGDVYTHNLTIVPQRCKETNVGVVPEGNKVPLHDEVLSIHQYWATGFYHSTLEGLPRLLPYVPFLRANPQVKINFQFQKTFLTFLDIPNLEERTVGNQRFRGRVVYSPAGGPCGRSPLLTTQLLSLYARRSLPNQPQLRDTIVLIKRSRKRFFNHHSAILAMLKREAASVGLKVMEFRDDPVPDLQTTRMLFNQAIMVVAPHGAGESNLIFSQPGTVIIEGLCWDELHRGNLCYRNLAQVLGLRYHALFYRTECKDITPEQVQQPVHFFLQHLDKIRR